MSKNLYEKKWREWKEMKQFGPASRHNRRILKKMIAPLSLSSVLDVGCGEGSLILELKNISPQRKFSGLDISRQALLFAKKQAPFADFFLADIQKKGLKKKFDLIIASEILEHLPDDLIALKKMRKMSKKYLLIYTLIGKMRGFEKNMGHVRNYTETDLIAKIEKAGFQIRKITKWGWPFYSPLYRNLLARVPNKTTTGRFGLFRKIISKLIFYLFFFNSWRRGDVIAVLAEAKSRGRVRHSA